MKDLYLQILDHDIEYLKNDINSDIKYLEQKVQELKNTLSNLDWYRLNDYGQFQSMLELEKKLTKYSTLFQARKEYIECIEIKERTK